jgi:secreted trypsin-like serine protease
MRFRSRSLTILLALAAIPAAASGAFAETKNWARDFVRQQEAAAFERATGIAPGTQPGIGPGMIVGGQQAAAGRWPFHVGLLLASEKNNFQAQFCAGTIVDDEFILTAAHCASFVPPNKLHILTGTQSLTAGGTRREVRAIKVHPRYDSKTLDFDIAIVQLENKIPNLGRNDKAKILTRADEAQLAPNGMTTFVTGWGSTGVGDGYPTSLRDVSVPIVGRGICNGPESYDGFITARMLCAGLRQGGKDSCSGDSGGPLLVKNGAGRFVMQAGITSWGEGCALPDFYGVYSRVAAMEPWITAIIDFLGGSVQSPSAAACADSGNRPASLACRRAAKQTEQEMAAYLDVIRRRGTPAQSQGAAAAQKAWSQSLGGLCAFEAAAGIAAREDCVTKQTRKRADDLAGQLSDLGS